MWTGKTTRDRRRNWLSFYCDKAVATARATSGKGTVQSCVGTSQASSGSGSRSGSSSSSSSGSTSSSSSSSIGGDGSGSAQRTNPSPSSSSSPPHFRCYTSRDSNWSLNAVMVHRRGALEQILKDPSAGKVRAYGSWVPFPNVTASKRTLLTLDCCGFDAKHLLNSLTLYLSMCPGVRAFYFLSNTGRKLELWVVGDVRRNQVRRSSGF